MRQHSQTEGPIRSDGLMATESFCERTQIGSSQLKQRPFLRLLTFPDESGMESRAQALELL
jgi:hypothetical protein